MSSSDPEAIQADIERTRADLAETVDQLSSRLARQRSKAAKVGIRAGIVLGGVAATLVVVRIVRARRS